MEKLTSKLGIDLGGTKIEGLLADKSGEQLKRIRVKTPNGSYGEILNAIANLVSELATTPDLPVGIGIPGSISPINERVRNSNILALNRRLFAKDLENTPYATLGYQSGPGFRSGRTATNPDLAYKRPAAPVR